MFPTVIQFRITKSCARAIVFRSVLVSGPIMVLNAAGLLEVVASAKTIPISQQTICAPLFSSRLYGSHGSFRIQWKPHQPTFYGVLVSTYKTQQLCILHVPCKNWFPMKDVMMKTKKMPNSKYLGTSFDRAMERLLRSSQKQ